jgi:hypothetical protein
VAMPWLCMQRRVVGEVVMDSLPSLQQPLLLVETTASAGTGALLLAPGTGAAAAKGRAPRRALAPDHARAVQAACALA